MFAASSAATAAAVCGTWTYRSGAYHSWAGDRSHAHCRAHDHSHAHWQLQCVLRCHWQRPRRCSPGSRRRDWTDASVLLLFVVVGMISVLIVVRLLLLLLLRVCDSHYIFSTIYNELSYQNEYRPKTKKRRGRKNRASKIRCIVQVHRERDRDRDSLIEIEIDSFV